MRFVKTAALAFAALHLAYGPALAADRKPLVLNATTGRTEQIPASDTLAPPALKVTGITGSTQCLTANSAGLVSGTGTPCGSGTGTIGGATGATDERLIRADGTGGSTIQAGAPLTLSDAGALGFADGVRQTFNPDGTNAGLNVGAQAGDPSGPSDGDLWYNSAAGLLKARAGSATAILGREAFCVAISDETTAITTGTAKVTFRMPYAFTLTAVRASLNTVSSSGAPAFDLNEGGASIFSTTLTIDASEKTSTTAATAAVISDSALADDAEMTIDIDTAGTGAKGAKLCLIGHQ
jgi:hypothetical protein